MLQDPLTLYKLIVLYMLDRVTFPLTTAQISDFILEKEYTNFLTLQQVIGELADTGLVTTRSDNNRTHLTLTSEGTETLHFFENRISPAIKSEIHTFFQEKEYSLREEVSVTSDYYKATSGEYEAHLIAKERGIHLIDLTISVPNKEMASSICDNWLEKNQIIYQYLIEQLF
ncbi:MAG: DUF4364 family protein [Lachnospiraceae bacterium]|nr:DUF4364 family protein [Lachnospiraceae bacterium]